MAISLTSCSKSEVNTSKAEQKTLPLQAELSAKKPNILWIFVEDISPDLGSYGETLVYTPNLDALAQKGAQFTNLLCQLLSVQPYAPQL